MKKNNESDVDMCEIKCEGEDARKARKEETGGRMVSRMHMRMFSRRGFLLFLTSFSLPVTRRTASVMRAYIRRHMGFASLV
jgi:hypothetical protein